MKPITPRMKLKRMDFLDYIMFALFFIIIGVMIGAFNKNFSNFAESEWVITTFILIVIAIRPIVRFFR